MQLKGSDSIRHKQFCAKALIIAAAPHGLTLSADMAVCCCALTALPMHIVSWCRFSEDWTVLVQQYNSGE